MRFERAAQLDQKRSNSRQAVGEKKGPQVFSLVRSLGAVAPWPSRAACLRGLAACTRSPLAPVPLPESRSKLRTPRPAPSICPFITLKSGGGGCTVRPTIPNRDPPAPAPLPSPAVGLLIYSRRKPSLDAVSGTGSGPGCRLFSDARDGKFVFCPRFVLAAEAVVAAVRPPSRGYAEPATECPLGAKTRGRHASSATGRFRATSAYSAVRFEKRTPRVVVPKVSEGLDAATRTVDLVPFLPQDCLKAVKKVDVADQWFSTIDVSRTPCGSAEVMEDPVRGERRGKDTGIADSVVDGAGDEDLEAGAHLA
ncbi:hypothetical protein HPB47_001254 [Ixodes persulcatus]|uniref:Uncharacterized protein n=1 Tax=Ixodes persulcatus TaxID=34615 RepID=A0AC60PPL2_IXOPE|nr:hypothetical protein HPB47_001254 [Ixodes persulcatus]